MERLYIKLFDAWHTIKKVIHERNTTPPLFKERDIWWVHLGVNIGFEEDGKPERFLRPVLILKKYNREIFLGIPLTTKIKQNKYYIPITVRNKTVCGMISQARTFSSKRLQDKLAELDTGDYKKIKSAFIRSL